MGETIDGAVSLWLSAVRVPKFTQKKGQALYFTAAQILLTTRVALIALLLRQMFHKPSRKKRMYLTGASIFSMARVALMALAKCRQALFLRGS